MNQELKFKGYTTSPSDFESPDGELSASINIISEDGELKQIQQPQVVATLPAGCKVVHIHKVNGIPHYIIKDASGNLKWATTAGLGTQTYTPLFTADSTITHINSVNNTLIVFTDDTHYFIWNDNSYMHLGTHIPEIDLSFGLKGKIKTYFRDHTDKQYSYVASGDGTNESFNKNAYTQLMAYVAKYIADISTEVDRFVFPFVLRYAIRLYDGSLVHHSAPILMMPNSAGAPYIVVYKKFTENTINLDSGIAMYDDLMMVSASIEYALTQIVENLSNWKDIISSVDIFVSAPIYTYDINKETDGSSNTMRYNFEPKFVGALNMGISEEEKADYIYPISFNNGTETTTAEPAILGNVHTEWSYKQLIPMMYKNKYERLEQSADNKRWGIQTTCSYFPYFTQEKIEEDIKNVNNFYLIKSIPIDDLPTDTNRRDLAIQTGVLKYLTSVEAMTDGYQTHDKLVAGSSYSYNNRINMFDIKRTLFNGHKPSSMFPYVNAYISGYSTGTDKTSLNVNFNSATNTLRADVYINNDGVIYKVSVTDTIALGKFTFNAKSIWGNYVFYPDANAYKMVIYEGSSLAYQFKLIQHPFLNGAYAFIGLDSIRVKNVSSVPTNVVTSAIEYPNKIYTSEVNNPFYFPATNINTLSAGKIIGISSAAKALSQGQFGEFPLYAFTDNGVWALSVSSTGVYSAVQPITRDVCTNAESITQLDSSVLFATDRGIMILEGSKATCITDLIDAEYPFNAVSKLPKFQAFHHLIHPSDDGCFPIASFLEYIKNAKMMFDYVHQRIVVYNDTITAGAKKYSYAYVYSLKSKDWGMMYTDIVSHLNSYPDCLAMDINNKLVSLSSKTNNGNEKGLILTRPIKLSDGSKFKTIDTIVVRGHFPIGKVSLALWASNDLYNWVLVNTSMSHELRHSHGTAYKYYRLGLTTDFTEDMSIYSASIGMISKYNNKMR